MTFTYYIDGQVIGSYIPINAEELKKAKFVLGLGIWGESAETLTGYFDDVRIGQIDQ